MIDDECFNAYIAGLLDGEGHVGVYSYGRTTGFNVIVSITNTHREVLEEIAKVFTTGKVTTRPRNSNSTRDCYALVFEGSKVVPILEAVKPFSRIKKRNIELVLELQTLRPGSGPTTGNRSKWTDERLARAVEIYEEVRSLNKRGGPNGSIRDSCIGLGDVPAVPEEVVSGF